MEIVTAAPGRGGMSPFHDHDVREWSRKDGLTGILERARLETDHWTTGTNNSSHKYGKVVDSRARTDADGSLQQHARRQLEVFQSQIPGAHLQIIKTQTVSSSRWSNKSSDSREFPPKNFENLQLTLNPLDLTSQKSKANVGRSVGRRPPSRPRAKEESLRTASQNFHRVPRLCHQMHAENAVGQTIKRQSEIIENDRLNGHYGLTRTKSTSSEDLHLEDKLTKKIEDLEDLDRPQSWRRTSKLRRSLQFPKQNKSQISKPTDIPKNDGGVSKIREELEKGRRLNTALRGNNVDLEALDQILRTISGGHEDDKPIENRDDLETKKQKRNSFVTVETLQEVRDRLRRTGSPTEEIFKADKEEDTDDGIVIEDTEEIRVNEKSKVRSFVYGMETTMMNKKPIVGTGSLESRSKLMNGGVNLRNEDWCDRRKSYGFERVHNQTNASDHMFLKNRGRVESSTDSGICRSSDFVMPPKSRTENFNCDNNNFTSVKHLSSIFDQGNGKKLKSTTITIPIVSKADSNTVDLCWDDVPDKEAKRHSIAVDESKYVMNHNDNQFRRTSLAVNPTVDDITSQNKKSKKVEFCKTEVHFAAESGKVNIVETDEKPPPTNNFRRRRRNSATLITDDFEKNCLPVLHFGDSSYEKVLLGIFDDDNFESVTNDDDDDDDDVRQNFHANFPYGTVTVNTTSNASDASEIQEEEKKDSIENVKGILKNKPIKPIPYHLGEDPFLNGNSDSDSGKWGINLKPIQKNDLPFWKSTVTLHNTVYKQNDVNGENESEFQKLLRNLRPTGGNKYNVPSDQKNSDNFSNEKLLKDSDCRRTFFVDDKVKLTEESKIYSTKINFSDGGTAVVENDRPGENRQNSISNQENAVKDYTSQLEKQRFGNEDYLFKTANFENDQSERFSNSHKPKPKENKQSLTRKSNSLLKTTELKNAPATDKLSSPSLVGRNLRLDLNNFNEYENRKTATEFVNVSDAKLHRKHSGNEIVLRQPKKSEMTYFGINVSPNSTKKIRETVIQKRNKHCEKPDLLHHVKTDGGATRNPSSEKDRSPIYENVSATIRPGKEIDNGIMEELTKAADQILQVVKGFTDEDSQNKHSGDDRNLKKGPVDVVTKSKSSKAKQDKKTNTINKQPNGKIKLKHTSSTSSIESLSKDKKGYRGRNSHQAAHIKKKNTINESTAVKANAKSRRLQRASSREALLQSHGSSSDDLRTNVGVPQRKPRQIKKTKMSQLTVTNGIEINKKVAPPDPLERKRDKSKDRRDRMPEIRHKAAISTIKNIAEKSSRDKSKSGIENSTKKVPQKRESFKGMSSKNDLKETISSKEICSRRISTAKIKKCHRPDEKAKIS